MTTAGDVLSWNVENGTDITITLKDGTHWTKDIMCSQCTTTNVFKSPKVMDGVENFLQATEMLHGNDDRRLGLVVALGDCDPNGWLGFLCFCW